MKGSWRDRVVKGLKDDEPFNVRVKDFDKYVDENGDPLLDPDGNQLYETQVVAKVEDPDARKLLRTIFKGAVEQAKASHH